MTASPLIVLERALQLHALLDGAGVAHALGGALALAYHVQEARATRDIDLNVQVDPADCELLLNVLPDDIPWDASDVALIRNVGQVRLLWPHPDDQPPIPLDLFFRQGEFHDLVHQRAELVSMLEGTIPIVSATHLMVFKMLYGRRKDWADIEELVRFGKVDLDEARKWLRRIVGEDNPRHATLSALLAELDR